MGPRLIRSLLQEQNQDTWRVLPEVRNAEGTWMIPSANQCRFTQSSSQHNTSAPPQDPWTTVQPNTSTNNNNAGHRSIGRHSQDSNPTAQKHRDSAKRKCRTDIPQHNRTGTMHKHNRTGTVPSPLAGLAAAAWHQSKKKGSLSKDKEKDA